MKNHYFQSHPLHHIDAYNFELPSELIAQYPLKDRTASRLMHVEQDKITHLHFSDLIDQLDENDLLVLNNTKVIPARLFGQKQSGGKLECLVERIIDEHQLLAHIRCSKSPKVDSEIILEKKINAKVIGREGDLFLLQILNQEPILHLLEKYGHIPLPPYIERSDETEDKARYQTVFAEREGAVAAPTAGLHFDDALLKKLKDKGVEQVHVTLHVGAGTFQPLRVEDIRDHHMHAEYIEVDQTVCDKINAHRAKGGRVVAVGTTVVRLLETAGKSGCMQAFMGDTNIFIYPGYEFKIIDRLITNFHLPKSSLLMLVSAFAGYDTMMQGYRIAIEEKYRFFSYGDAMLLDLNSV